MNQREPTSVPQGSGRTFPCLALLLLPLLSGVPASAGPLLHPAGLTQQKTYLVALGAPPLRFQEPVPAAALAIRPPIPGASAPRSSELDVAVETSESPLAPSGESSALSSPPSLSLDNEIDEPADPEDPIVAPARSPRPILPDEMRPQARAEDFLPFFQIPAAHPDDVTVFAPVPRTPARPSSLPTSSATYRQTPR